MKYIIQKHPCNQIKIDDEIVFAFERDSNWTITEVSFNEEITHLCITIEKMSERKEDEADMINGQPTADVKPVVRGEWVFNSYDEDAYDVHGNKSWANRYYCSNCNFERAFIEDHTGQYNYCPNCGADMRGGTK